MRKIRVTAKKRQELLSKTKSVTKGRQRYYRRLFSKIQIPNRAIQSTNVAKWFEIDILDVDISVTGETDDYIVSLTFGFVWKNYDKTKPFSEKNIRDAITRAFRNEDILLYCSCPDFRYRYAYIATQQGYIIDESHSEYRPAKITNPNDSLGSACKHVLLVLMQGHAWIYQLANTTYKYVQRIKRRQPRLYDMFIRDRIEDKIEDEVEEIVPEIEEDFEEEIEE